jgi:hypothetical protein
MTKDLCICLILQMQGFFASLRMTARKRSSAACFALACAWNDYRPKSSCASFRICAPVNPHFSAITLYGAEAP